MVDKKIHEKEAEEFKKLYKYYLDKRKDFMEKTQFKVEDIFGDIISQDRISQEQITKFDNFFSKKNVIENIKISFNVFKPRKK